MHAVLALCALSTVAAFVSKSTPASTSALSAKSKSVPFLDAPANLDESMPGYAGFDPLGLASTFPNVMAFEIKHGS